MVGASIHDDDGPMRPHLAAAVVVSALLVSGCSGGDDATETGPSSSASSTAPGPSTPSGETEPTAEPSTASSPTGVRLDLTDDVMLAPDELEPVGETRGSTDQAETWFLSSACSVPAAPEAVAVQSVSQGVYESTDPVGIQTVAVFEDAETATAVADRVGAAMDACVDAPPAESGTYRVEDLEVGTQGRGLANSYAEPGDEGAGSYAAVTRRGNAVTIVAMLSGETSVGSARDAVVSGLGTAFDRLCSYDSAGC